MPTHEELLTASQVAEILKCHVTQVYKMIKRGQLPKMVKFGQRMSRMRRSQLNECLRQTSQDVELRIIQQSEAA
jgi:excisionase family DNA binding protein